MNVEVPFSGTLSIKVIRADGTVEDLGEVATLESTHGDSSD